MKLIQTTDYLLLIDEEAEIKKGDLFLGDDNRIKQCTLNNSGNINFKGGWYSGSSNCKKLIAYYPLIKDTQELNLPLLPNPFKDEFNNINELAIKHWESRTYEDMDICCNNFIAGYKAAQSKQFSLEDVKKAIEMAREIKDNEDIFDIDSISGLTEVCTYNWEERYSTEEIIKSLTTQQLPKEFIPEYEKEIVQIIDNESLTKTFFKEVDYENLSKDVGVKLRDKRGGLWDFPTYNRFKVVKPKRLKTITNSEGKEELVGAYR